MRALIYQVWGGGKKHVILVEAKTRRKRTKWGKHFCLCKTILISNLLKTISDYVKGSAS